MTHSLYIPKFAEVIEFGIALLEGGNQDIQKSLFNQLKAGTLTNYCPTCLSVLSYNWRYTVIKSDGVAMVISSVADSEPFGSVCFFWIRP